MTLGLDGIAGFPRPRQQFVESVGGMAVDHALEHVAQIGVRLDVVQLGRLDQRAHGSPARATTIRASEQVVLLPSATGLMARSTGLVSSSTRPSSRKRRQRVPTTERIADGVGQRAAAGTRQLRLEPSRSALTSGVDNDRRPASRRAGDWPRTRASTT